jgi:hypothetical protein
MRPGFPAQVHSRLELGRVASLWASSERYSARRAPPLELALRQRCSAVPSEIAWSAVAQQVAALPAIVLPVVGQAAALLPAAVLEEQLVRLEHEALLVRQMPATTRLESNLNAGRRFGEANVLQSTSEPPRAAKTDALMNANGKNLS